MSISPLETGESSKAPAAGKQGPISTNFCLLLQQLGMLISRMSLVRGLQMSSRDIRPYFPWAEMGRWEGPNNCGLSLPAPSSSRIWGTRTAVGQKPGPHGCRSHRMITSEGPRKPHSQTLLCAGSGGCWRWAISYPSPRLPSSFRDTQCKGPLRQPHLAHGGD